MDPVTERITEDYLTQRAKAISERKERELYCAWRAGYDYLYELQKLKEDFTVGREYIPSNQPHRKFSDRRKTIMRYDLSRISRSDIRDLDSSHTPTGT